MTVARRVVLFAKPPLPGRAKTRLATELGPEAAARIAKALLLDTIALCEGLPGRFPEWDLRLVLAHDQGAEWFAPRLSAEWRMLAQCGASLDERLETALADLAPATDDATIFLGMDSPQMPPQRVSQACAALEGARAVLGPCADGGYYLLGVRGGLPAGTLAGVRWSTEHALADTRAALERAGPVVAELAPGEDIDTPEDLRRLAAEIAAGTAPDLPNCRRVLLELGLL